MNLSLFVKSGIIDISLRINFVLNSIYTPRIITPPFERGIYDPIKISV